MNLIGNGIELRLRWGVAELPDFFFNRRKMFRERRLPCRLIGRKFCYRLVNTAEFSHKLLPYLAQCLRERIKLRNLDLNGPVYVS